MRPGFYEMLSPSILTLRAVDFDTGEEFQSFMQCDSGAEIDEGPECACDAENEGAYDPDARKRLRAAHPLAILVTVDDPTLRNLARSF